MADADKIKGVTSASAAMAQSDVWYRLYYENGEEIGDESSISPIPKNISYLKKEVKQQYNEVLQHCSAGQLNVYRHGTNFPVAGDNRIRPQSAVPVLADHTLVVVAPNKPAPAAASAPAFGPYQLLSYEDTDKYFPLGSVESLEKLRESVASTLKVDDPIKIRLFGGCYDKAHNEVKFSRIVDLSDLARLQLQGRNDGPILLRYAPTSSETPPPSPPQIRSEISVEDLQKSDSFRFPVSFHADIPEFYHDQTSHDLEVAVSNTTVDNPALLLMSVPGAGKTRTVQHVAKTAGAGYHREKFTDGHNFIIKLRAIARKRNISAPQDYQSGKSLFVTDCDRFVRDLLQAKKSSGIMEKVFILHFDECQLLMGENVVSKQMKPSEDLFDYAMPAFGDVVSQITTEYTKLRVVFSGTNFFASLAFTIGSQLKTASFDLDGGLPLDWCENLLRKHFRLGSVGDLKNIIGPMCANRRAFQFFARRLETIVKGVGKVASKENLSSAAEIAYKEWSAPIKRCVGKARRCAVSLLALITYPNAWNGTEKDGKLEVPNDELSDDVVQYALGGAVNLRRDEDISTISIPVGCTMQLLCDICNTATSADNMKQFEVFRYVSKTVSTDKGHFFERAVACELTFFSSKLYKTLLSTTGLDVMPHHRVIGQPFVYCSMIHRANWDDPKIFCVEDTTDSGQRLVDVGFPVVESKSNVTWKIFSELKVVTCQNQLWRLCWSFFQKMESIGVGGSQEKTVAVFLSFHEFMSHEPGQRKTTKGPSAHDSRKKVMNLLEKKAKYFAVVDASRLKNARTVLPLVDLYQIIEQKTLACSGLTEISNQVDDFYSSSSQPAPGIAGPMGKKAKFD